MDKEELLKLPPVLFAPFLAAGALTVYFGGGFAGGILFAAAAAFTIVFARRYKTAAVCSAGAAVGAAVMLIYTCVYSSVILSYADKTVRAEFKVTEVTSNSGDTRQFIGEMNLGSFRAAVKLTGASEVEVGDTAVAVIELERADRENEITNLAKGVLLSGTVSEYIEIKPSAYTLEALIDELRGKMINELSSTVFGDERELALSMFFGKDEGLSQSLSERIRISGASHFTAVSGAHFAVLAAVLLQFFPSKNRRARAVFSFLITPFAVVFFGASISVIRSSLMFFIMSVAPLFYRRSNTLNSLCVTVCAILTFMPQAVLDIGFAMSVLGVLGAGVAGPAIGKKIAELLPDKAKFVSPIITVFFSSMCAVICTAPISAAVFKGVSLNAVLTSMLVMPLLAVGMTFMLLLGITGAGIFAVPVGLSTRLIVMTVNFFGKSRTAFINLDFTGAWILAAICAVLVLTAAFGNMKTLKKCASGIAVVSAVSIGLTVYTNETRCEIRFVGNSTTSAAIVICKNSADVFVAGSGVGLADDISRCMREHGAYNIKTLAALEADLSGELALSELSELVEIDSIYLSDSISGISAKIVDKNSEFSVNGITLASAAVSDSEASADIILCHGSIRRSPQTSAKLAVYFTNTKYELPENSVNIYRLRDYRVLLKSDVAEVKITQN